MHPVGCLPATDGTLSPPRPPAGPLWCAGWQPQADCRGHTCGCLPATDGALSSSHLPRFTNRTCLQVHSAVLAGSRKEVVVKVLRPGTEDVLLTDLNFVSVQRRQRTRWAQVVLLDHSAECAAQAAGAAGAIRPALTAGFAVGGRHPGARPAALPATGRHLHTSPARSLSPFC